MLGNWGLWYSILEDFYFTPGLKETFVSSCSLDKKLSSSFYSDFSTFTLYFLSLFRPLYGIAGTEENLISLSKCERKKEESRTFLSSERAPLFYFLGEQAKLTSSGLFFSKWLFKQGCQIQDTILNQSTCLHLSILRLFYDISFQGFSN